MIETRRLKNVVIFTLIIFLFISQNRIGFYNIYNILEWDSITLFTKMNFFSSKTHISTTFAQDINGILFTNINIF